MKQRITSHQQRRIVQTADWLTIEEPIALAKILQSLSDKYDRLEMSHNQFVLVDCLTLWLSNLLLNLNEKQRQKEIDALFNVLKHCKTEVIFVSNETGLGIVPMNQLSRQFIDLAGGLHQRMATVSERVILIVAGLPLVLKGKL
jgi:adenosylcobinamide kinase/adenosylcobinamide-phosphate guanylyltransferase